MAPEGRDEGISVQDHLRAAYTRAKYARLEAEQLLAAGFYDAALVWAVRSAEILVRDFVLAPYFLTQGVPWTTAMQRAKNLLGESNWKKAFAKAEEWFGPFDEPMTTDGDNAWTYWKGTIVRRRGDIVHGRFTQPADPAEARAALDFAERMATWFSQRFVVSDRHPIGLRFRQTMDELQMRATKEAQTDEGI